MATRIAYSVILNFRSNQGSKLRSLNVSDKTQSQTVLFSKLHRSRSRSMQNLTLTRRKKSKLIYSVEFSPSWMPANNNFRILSTKFTFRTFTNSARSNSPNVNTRQKSRRRTLLLLTYISGGIGICLLGAVGLRQYLAFARRAGGVEDIRVREYGRRPHLFRYRGFCFSDIVVNDVKGIHQFDVREDDIWVVSFPKAGTTWLQEIVFLVNSGADFEKAAAGNIEERFPYFEWIFPGKKAIATMPSPRLIKSHLPLSLLPNEVKEKRPKIIYIARNPKDTVVSYYHFLTKFLKLKEIKQVFNGTFEDYCRLFVEDLVHYGPWWKHVKEAWDRRNEENLLVIFYEDLQIDPHKAVQEVATFLNKPLTNSQVEAIVQHCSFGNMKNNKATNYDWLKDAGIARPEQRFMRKGEVGDWKNHLSTDIVQKLDEIVATKLAGVPIRDALPEKRNFE